MADVAFEVEADSLNELFKQAGLAVTNIMVEDLSKIEPLIKKEIELSSDNVETLLFNFLQELIFIKDTERLIFGRFDVEVIEREDNIALHANCVGEEINLDKHKVIVDPKAITMHKFETKKINKRWWARVVVDV